MDLSSRLCSSGRPSSHDRLAQKTLSGDSARPPWHTVWLYGGCGRPLWLAVSPYALGSPEALLSGKLPLYPGARGDLAAIERHVHCSRSSGTMLVVYVNSPLVPLSPAVLSARSDWSCAYDCRAADGAAWNEQFPCKGGASQRHCPSRSGGSGSRISYCTYHLSSIISTAVSLLLSARFTNEQGWWNIL